MTTSAQVRQLIYLFMVIVALVAFIRVQQGFELQQLLHHPSLLWRGMFSKRGY